MTPAQALAKEQARAKRDGLERAVHQQLRALGLTDGMLQQHQFHQTRKWRFDFAWPAEKLALEVDGGTWVAGRHSRGAGMAADCEKQAAAVIAGWRVLRCTTDHVKSGEAARWVAQALQEQQSA